MALRRFGDKLCADALEVDGGGLVIWVLGDELAIEGVLEDCLTKAPGAGELDVYLSGGAVGDGEAPLNFDGDTVVLFERRKRRRGNPRQMGLSRWRPFGSLQPAEVDRFTV